MSTPIANFDYDLPESFIAQRSVEPRDRSKLMLLDKVTGEIRHRRFFEIIDEFKRGDVLVFNVTKVFKARLLIDGVEIFVLKISDREIEVLLKPGKKFAVGDPIKAYHRAFTIVSKSADGVVVLRTDFTSEEMFDFCEQYGEVPVPPYVEQGDRSLEKYQTVYARERGSAAAPTAGFHFTPELIDRLRMRGVQIEEVVLHVGIGTFRPLQTETLEEHAMHAEWVSVDAGTAERIVTAKQEDRRIIAVGTTTTRVLEGIAEKFGELKAYEGEINMFIKPGFTFQIIDGLITNFHLPKSTLLVLVSALAGRENILKAYEEAKKNSYRFFSFGDAMFVR